MTTQQILDDRYGRSRGTRSPRFWAIFAAVAIALGVGVVAWFAFASPGSSVSAETTGYELVDEHTVVVSFQVTSLTDDPLACALEAQDEDHGIVGWRVVEYPASSDHSRAFRESIPVTAPATTGFVNICWVP